MIRVRTCRLAVGIAAALAWGLCSAGAQAAPPVLTVPGSQTVAESDLLEFTVTATDPDGQQVDLYASAMPAGADFVDNRNNTGRFSWTPDLGQSGSYEIWFTADDTFGGMDTKSVAIEVVRVNHAPVLDPIGDRTVERGSTLIVSLNGSDPDGDALQYQAAGLPAYGTLTDFGDGTGALQFSPGAATPTGPSTMTITLTDGSLSDSETFTITVVASAAQNPPVLAAIGSRTVAEGTATSFTVSASDPDGDALTWTVSLPGFVNFTVTQSGAGTSAARLDLAPGYCASGTYPASVSVSDGALSDAESFSIAVTDVNRTPAWNTPGEGFAMSVLAGGSGSLGVSASDPDQACGGPAPALSVHGSDAGELLNASMSDHGDGTGSLTVAAQASVQGTYHVTIRATDRADGSKYQDAPVAVTVYPAGLPAVARAWFEFDPMRLDIGRPRERVDLEPVDHSFELSSVVLSSIRLRAWPGSGTVEEITPIPDRFAFGGDRDQNGVAELRMEFSKDDLRALLAYVTGRVEAPLTLTALLTDGRALSTTLTSEVVPPRQHVIRRLGPNPLNPEAILMVRMEQSGRLLVRVFDLAGRLVRTVVDDPNAAAGDREVHVDGRDDLGRTLASGRYFVRVDVPGATDTQSITLLK